MYTRLSVQIFFTEIESMLFSNIFQWQIHVLDKEGDAGVFSPTFPQDVFVILPTQFFYYVLSINVVGLFYVTLLRLVIHVYQQTHLDD